MTGNVLCKVIHDFLRVISNGSLSLKNSRMSKQTWGVDKIFTQCLRVENKGIKSEPWRPLLEAFPECLSTSRRHHRRDW